MTEHVEAGYVERRPRVLWLTPQSFWPPWGGGRMRLFQLLLGLRRADFDVEVWTIGDTVDPLPDFLRDVTVREFPARSRVGLVSKVTSVVSSGDEWTWRLSTAVAVGEFRRRAGEFDVVIAELARFRPFLRTLDVTTPWILDLHDFESNLWRDLYRSGAVNQPWWIRLRLRLDAWKVVRNEKALIDAAALTVTVSKEDEAAVLDAVVDAKTAVVANGVDLEFFRFQAHQSTKTDTLLFTGTLSYSPNLDALAWFVDRILKNVREARPRTKLLVVGKDPERASELLSHVPMTEVLGPVDDIRPFFDRADVFVLPLRVGGGTRLKALEAFACGVPVVSTNLGVQGLGVPEHAALVSDDEQAFAANVVRALSDNAFRERAIREARLVAERFDWVPIGDAFAETVRDVAARRSNHGASHERPHKR